MSSITESYVLCKTFNGEVVLGTFVIRLQNLEIMNDG